MRLLLDTHTFLWFILDEPGRIIAEASVEQVAVVSGDSAFDAYGITRLW